MATTEVAVAIATMPAEVGGVDFTGLGTSLAEVAQLHQ